MGLKNAVIGGLVFFLSASTISEGEINRAAPINDIAEFVDFIHYPQGKRKTLESAVSRLKGNYQQGSIRHQGKRTYLAYIPHSLEQNPPLVVWLHNATGNGEQFMEQLRLDRLSDEEKIISLFPDGTGFPDSTGRRKNDKDIKSYFWNAEHCCGPAFYRNVDDVGFIKKLIMKFRDEHCVDPKRIYVAGFSNGGMLAHKLGSDYELSKLIAGIGVIGGSNGGRVLPRNALLESVPLGDKLSAFLAHGAEDDRVPYHGGRMNSGFPKIDSSFEESSKVWIYHNECNLLPRIDIGDDDKGYQLTVFSTPDRKYEVAKYTFINAGHYVVPGVTRQMVDFFKKHPKE